MLITYDFEKLSAFLEDLKCVTGIAGYICNNAHDHAVAQELQGCEFCRLIGATEEGERRCIESDDCLYRKCHDTMHIQYHRCHAGLFDIATPIVKEHLQLGFIMLGQIVVTENEDDTPFTFADIKERLKGVPVDMDVLKAAYDKLPQHNLQYVQSLATLIELFSKSIWTEDVIRIGSEDVFWQLLTYLEKHLHENLSVEHICSQFWISPATLYERFHKYCSCTYNEYLTKLRMEKAKTLLICTNDTIEKTAATVGIHDRSYFSHTFREYTGFTPKQYRKQYQNNPKGDLLPR